MKWLELAATNFDEALRKSEGVVVCHSVNEATANGKIVD
jgi:hypothetical protein